MHLSLQIYTLYLFVSHQTNDCGGIVPPSLQAHTTLPPGPTVYECMYVSIYNVHTPTSCMHHAGLVFV